MATTPESDVINALEEAEMCIKHVDERSLRVDSPCSHVPEPIMIVLQAIGIFLQPNIPSDKFTWKEGRALLETPNLLQTLLMFDKEQITTDQLARAASYMTRKEMQTSIIGAYSSGCVAFLKWFQAMYLCGQMKHRMVAH